MCYNAELVVLAIESAEDDGNDASEQKGSSQDSPAGSH